jgi:thiol-disulfide isomerase/thioredoxin
MNKDSLSLGREMKDRFKPALLLALACLGVLWALASWPGTSVGQAADNFKLTPAEGGKPISLSQFKGKPTVVVFWATWCPPCRREIPTLKNIHKDYTPKGLQMVSVAIAFKESRDDVVKFKKVNELPYLVLWDEDNKTADQYAVEGIPTVLLVDAKGIIRFRGYNLDEEFMKVLDSLTKS